MRIEIRLKHQSQAIEYSGVKNTYEKGSFYCVYLANGSVKKYPITDIFDLTESY